MTTRMSDDRDDHISRSKTNDPTRDTRESRGKARTRDDERLNACYYALFYLTFYILYIL